ncbi:MAG: hypothetical protein JSV00_00185 [bacterium]|nr:MAG: hypothetical protein JSV00_00185 [bacterium]
MEAGSEVPIHRFSIRRRLPWIISAWFLLQVLLNVAAALYLAVYPPPEPATLFDRMDLTVNTGVNAALAVGFWKVRPWAWSTALVLIPLYWTIHLWHMLVPIEGLMLWPFLMVDAAVVAYLLGPAGRAVFLVPEGRWERLSLLPPAMAGLALYALLAPVTGLGPAAVAAAAAALVGWWRALKARVGRGDALAP